VVDVADILRFVDEVAEKFRPQRVILFGSYAYGTPNEDSDVDILVVMNYRGKNHEKIIKIRQTVDYPFPMDLLVHNEAEISRRIRWNDFFLREIMEKGLILYDADDAKMGLQGRRRLRRRIRAVALA
jgi:predicted nucleotidyltransferase